MKLFAHLKLSVARVAGLLATFTSCYAQSVPTAQVAAPKHSNTNTQCIKDPLNQSSSGRSLYLRGTFNQWTAPNEHRFTWICNRYELVANLNGEHKFKVGDEAWSADADFGGSETLLPNKKPIGLLRIGKEINTRFNGTYRFVVRPAITQNLTMNKTENSPPEANPSAQLSVETCQPKPPLGETTLFIRGTMNNWAALDDYALQFSCDAYYINLKLDGSHNFKIADAAWAMPTTFGAFPGGRSTPAHDHPLELNAQSKPGGAADLNFNFNGEMTVKLDFEAGQPRVTIGGLSFADPKTATVTDPIALSIVHDSRNGDKQPFGAITPGTLVNFGFNALLGISKATLVIDKRRLEGNQEVLEYSPVVRIAMQGNRNTTTERWQADYAFDSTAIYGYWFELEVNGQLYAYQNNSDTVYWTREKGSGGKGAIEPHVADAQGYKRIRRFRLTSYAANFVVPDWAQDAVYYYIFPERFRNGNKANDPRPGTRRYQDKAVEFHNNWNDPPWKPNTGDGSDSVYNNDFFGGDLEGIIQKLDYIKTLGANVIYMTPIFKAASNHKYDTADYLQIDPDFGTNADFVRLTEQARLRGIRVMLDVSLNHTGADSKYFDRFGNFAGANQSKSELGSFYNGKINPQSPYSDWYVFDASQKETDKQFKGWVGVSDLPELNKNSASYRRFAYKAPDSVTRSWLTKGASGWRMDVAPWVPDEFWREWRKAVKATDPNAMTVAETWFESGKYFLGDTFDSTMNYIFRGVVLDYAMGGNAKKLYAQMELMREMYPKQAFYALMNLVSSHDQARALHVFGWKQEGENATVSHSTTAAQNTRAIELAKQRLRFATLFQMLYPGSPAIYYGDEAAVTGGDDPFNRGTYPWEDQGGKPDLQMIEEFKRFTKLRHDHSILRRGTINAPLVADNHVIALLRQFNNEWAITATNNANESKTIRIQLPKNIAANANFLEVLSAKTVSAREGFIDVTIEAMSGVFLKLNN